MGSACSMLMLLFRKKEECELLKNSPMKQRFNSDSFKRRAAADRGGSDPLQGPSKGWIFGEPREEQSRLDCKTDGSAAGV